MLVMGDSFLRMSAVGNYFPTFKLTIPNFNKRNLHKIHVRNILEGTEKKLQLNNSTDSSCKLFLQSIILSEKTVFLQTTNIEKKKHLTPR